MVEITGRFSALTGTDGRFALDQLPLTEYTLITRSLAHREQRRTVALSAEAPTQTVDFALLPSTNALQEVEVLGRKETTYKSNYSFVGTKTASALIDVPQSISTVTKELMEDRQALRLTDVMKSVAGVTQYSQYDDFTIRGFRNGYESGFRLLNGLRSGFGYGNSLPWSSSLTCFRPPSTPKLASTPWPALTCPRTCSFRAVPEPTTMRCGLTIILFCFGRCRSRTPTMPASLGTRLPANRSCPRLTAGWASCC